MTPHRTRGLPCALRVTEIVPTHYTVQPSENALLLWLGDLAVLDARFLDERAGPNHGNGGVYGSVH